MSGAEPADEAPPNLNSVRAEPVEARPEIGEAAHSPFDKPVLSNAEGLRANGLQKNKPVVVAFDFDGTLTRHDTMFPFLLHVAGWGAFIRHVTMLAPTLAGYGLGLIRNDIAKERVFTRFLSGMDIGTLRDKGVQFAENKLPGLLRAESMRRLAWHKQQGHRCVVISASLELYVQPWAKKTGFDDVIATHLETLEDGRITGNLSGKNCFGPEKIRRLEELLGPTSGYTLYAYGDSRGDRELLAAADHAYYQEIPDKAREMLT